MAHEAILVTKLDKARNGYGVAHQSNGYAHHDEDFYDEETPQSEAGSYVSEALY